MSRIETADFFLDKAKFSDWEAMYRNVWRHPECARYMMWRVTENEDDARARIQRTIEFQKTHDTYLVYDKMTREAIGFAGVEQVSPDTFMEAGVCLGPEYQGKGYGRQILGCLIDYCRREFGAKEFLLYTREDNQAAKRVVHSFGFVFEGSEEKTDERNGQTYMMEKYRLGINSSPLSETHK